MSRPRVYLWQQGGVGSRTRPTDLVADVNARDEEGAADLHVGSRSMPRYICVRRRVMKGWWLWLAAIWWLAALPTW